MKRDFSLLADRQFDLLVCGGGVYGAWTAYDAALRGLSVAIVEQGDWACATSSASSKLIHGGLRYLESYDFKLVKKAVAERQRLLALAPHRVWPLRFGIPVYRHSRIGSLRLKIGLSAYDFLAAPPGNIKPDADMAHCHFDGNGFSARFSALDSTDLQGGYTYADAQTDDARLVLELIAGAMQAGAVAVNYCQLVEMHEAQENEAQGRIYSATVRDQLSDTQLQLRCTQIVNTSGQWLSETQQGRDWCRMSKGVHLVMPGVLSDEALLLTAPSDGRVFFMIPWYGMTLLGTTDTDYQGDINHVSVTANDVRYLLDAANHYLNTGWTETDVVGSYAGLRVMKHSSKAAPSAVSRDWELKSTSSGVHYSIGGKLTSAREDAAHIVDAVCARLHNTIPCATAQQLFPWMPEENYAAWFAAVHVQAVRLGIMPESASCLIRRHGKRVAAVLHSVAADPQLGAHIVAGLPFIYADLLYCAGNEMVIHLDDLLRRRMPLLLLAQLERNMLRRIADLVAPLMGWNEAAINREIAACARPVQHE